MKKQTSTYRARRRRFDRIAQEKADAMLSQYFNEMFEASCALLPDSTWPGIGRSMRRAVEERISGWPTARGAS